MDWMRWGVGSARSRRWFFRVISLGSAAALTARGGTAEVAPHAAKRQEGASGTHSSDADRLLRYAGEFGGSRADQS